MSRTYTKNFFTQFYDFVKLTTTNAKVIDKDLVTLSTKLVAYMKSRKWVKREIEWSIFKDYNKLTDFEIAKKNDLTISNYRVMMTRLTTRLNSRLFFGDTLEDVIKDKTKVKDAIKTLNFALSDLDLQSEFELVKLPKHSKEITDENERKMYAVLAYILSKNGKIKLNVFSKEKLKYYIKNIEDTYNEEYLTLTDRLNETKTGQEFVSEIIDFLTLN